jgi:hypothetical protein
MKTINQLILIFTLCISFASVNANSQVTQQWTGYYNGPTNGSDQVHDMVIDSEDNVYVTGKSSASNTGNDFATVKYNSAGIQQWAVRYNSQSNFSDLPVGLAVDGSGNVYVAGSKSLGGSYGLINLVKYNSSGIHQWTVRCGDSVFTASPGAIALDASGNIYVGGLIKTYSTDDGSYLLAKFSPNGDSIWKRTYDPSIYPQGLGSGITCLKVDGSFIYAAGKSYNTDGLFTLYTSMRMIKYDLNGNTIWMSNDSLINGSDEVIGMDMDPSGNIFVTCNYGTDILTFKFNSTGSRLWKTLYTGIAGSYYDIATGIAADHSGNVVLSANSRRSPLNNSDDYATLKYDANGNLLWERLYNGTMNSSDYPYGITTDASDNVYVTGYSLETGFDFNAVTIKYNSSGVQLWKTSFDGGNNENEDRANLIEIDGKGNVIIAGYANQAGHNEDFMAVKYSQTVGVAQVSSHIPERFSLSQNYPNPFNPVTNIEFRISKSGFVSLKVFDLLGKELTTLVSSNLTPGFYKYDFDASGLPSGVYFYQLSAGDFTETKKLTVVK